jgi:hypothetical protein
MNSEVDRDSLGNVPLNPLDDAPLDPVVYGHHGVRKPKRRYIRPLDVQKLAEDVFTSSRKGITFLDVITKGLAKHKPQAQLLLKRSRSGGFLFTFKDTRPQRYYATSINSEVMKYLLSENAQGSTPNSKSFVKTSAFKRSSNTCSQCSQKHP